MWTLPYTKPYAAHYIPSLQHVANLNITLHFLGTTIILLSTALWRNIVMDDWNLDEKSLDKWQGLQSYKSIIIQKKITRNDK